MDSFLISGSSPRLSSLSSLEEIRVRFLWNSGAELPEDEAGFFALHIVNAELDGNIHHTMETPEVIDDIVNIVRFTYKTDLDEESLSYERFITHLKYFLQRAESKIYYQPDDGELFDIVRKKFPEAPER